jgi:hypothetical protein
MEIIKDAGEQPAPRLHRRLGAELRPLLAVRGAGASLCAGSGILLRRGWAVLGERYSLWERLGVLAVACYLAAYGTAHAPDVARFAIPAAAVAWCTAAWWAAPPATVEEHEPEPAEEPEEEPARSSDDDIRAATLDWIRQQIGDRQGVHLRDLLTHAQAHGMFATLDVSELRTHLERHGVPVRNRVRVRGLGVTVGIHRDDLPAPSGPLPEHDAQDPPDPELHAV